MEQEILWKKGDGMEPDVLIYKGVSYVSYKNSGRIYLTNKCIEDNNLKKFIDENSERGVDIPDRYDHIIIISCVVEVDSWDIQDEIENEVTMVYNGLPSNLLEQDGVKIKWRKGW